MPVCNYSIYYLFIYLHKNVAGIVVGPHSEQPITWLVTLRSENVVPSSCVAHVTRTQSELQTWIKWLRSEFIKVDWKYSHKNFLKNNYKYEYLIQILEKYLSAIYQLRRKWIIDFINIIFNVNISLWMCHQKI